MPKDYLLDHGTRETPQSEPMRADQVENDAGGFVWAVDEWTQLRRFLILGAQGGSYYNTERELAKRNVTAVRKCIDADGPRTVETIVEISDSGRAAKNDQALFALAVALSHGDKNTRHLAAEALPQVARIGTHLYHFVAYAETMRGWGRTLRWAVENWFDKHPDQLALQAIKYRQRDGWSGRDLLRLAHPGPIGADITYLDTLGFISGNTNHAWVESKRYGVDRTVEPWQPSEITHPLIQGFLEVQKAETPQRAAELVREFNLPREALPTEHLNSPEVWEALLESGEHGMPMTAMIRNLATMTRLGLLTVQSEATRTVLAKLGDADQIKKARIHPFNVFVAQMTYASGRGLRSDKTWAPVGKIVDALDAAFYTAFGNVDPIPGYMLIALDTSGSMQSGAMMGVPGITPARAQAVLALVTVATSPDVEVIGFDTDVVPIALTARQRIDDAYRISALAHGHGTDASLPMTWATQNKRRVDAFIVSTDGQTWAGHRHPQQALDQHRERMGVRSRLANLAMVANEFTVAAPDDPGVLEFVGFDSAAPQLISDFVSGKV